MKKQIRMAFIIISAILALVAAYFFVGRAPGQKDIAWGVNFSQMQAEALGLDWKETYLAILQDLGAKNIKLLTQWDWVQGQRPHFYFKDIDWQLQQAQANQASVIYVVGMKTGRWPECHVPAWAAGLSKEQQQAEILTYIETVIQRYKGSPAIKAWQAENEPLFDFGQCPWYDKEFLKKEVALIKSLDPSRPVIISDSGEQSLWWEAASIGDVVTNTMYRKLWFDGPRDTGFYASFPIPPVFYWRKAQLVRHFFGKEVFCGELQAEPWAPGSIYDITLEEQEKSMDIRQFKSNVEYAKKTGLPAFYFWGAEWWYWLKQNHQKPQIWDSAREILAHSKTWEG